MDREKDLAEILKKLALIEQKQTSQGGWIKGIDRRTEEIEKQTKITNGRTTTNENEIKLLKQAAAIRAEYQEKFEKLKEGQKLSYKDRLDLMPRHKIVIAGIAGFILLLIAAVFGLDTAKTVAGLLAGP